MSANAALVTAAAKETARANLDNYAAAAYVHMTGDYTQHSAVRIYAQAFLDSAGNRVNAVSAPVVARLGLTLESADYAVLCPVTLIGAATGTDSPPLISVQPANSTVPAGSAATLRVVALSSLPLGYQWYKDGVALADETSDQLLMLDAQPSDQSEYYVTVSNSAGTVTSLTVTLTVT